ncbi:MAG: hypothetical protein JXB88_09360 [Spirochaetales bacterium]|nr:hypothetical protein [Spirochaetales bacterium]
MKIKLLIGILFLIISFPLSAQFVGDAGAASSSSQSAAMGKPSFIIKFGAAIPIGEYKTLPTRTANPQYSSGIMGAKTGFFFEAGMGMSLTNPDLPVGFYYYPVLGAYWQTPLNWSELGGFFEDKAIYTKPVKVIDIGQRYGILVKPVDNFLMAAYYRPGLIIPLKFEVTHESVSDGESFLFTGEMATGDDVPLFMMSHSFGFTVRYMIASLSVERYSARPTYDVRYIDMDINPLSTVDISTKGKIPVKMMLVSIALDF